MKLPVAATHGAHFFFALCCLLLLLASTPVRSTMVAYYGFDDATTPTLGFSGYCPNVVPQGTLTGAAKVVTNSTTCRFGSCLAPSGGYMGASGLQVFQGSSTSRLSVSVWARTPATIANGAIVYKSGLVSVATALTGCLFPGFCSSNQLQCTMTFSTGQSTTVASSGKVSANTVYNIACVYNGQQVCFYLNGVQQSCSSVSSVFAEVGTLMIGSDGTNAFQGSIDEVKIYDHALSSSEISLINGAVAANDQPQVQIEVNGTVVSSYSTQALTNVTMSAAVQDAKQAYSGAPQNAGYASTFVYSWEVLTSTCGSTNLGSSDTQDTTISFLAISSSTVKLCASDGEIAMQATLTALATASTPVLILQPSDGTIEIPEGAVGYPITVEGSGLPVPSYQWQMLVTKEVNVTTNVTVVKRDNGEEELIFERDLVAVQEFEAIPGGTSGTLILNGTLAWNDTIIRCLIYNGGGSVSTDNFTIEINTAASPTPGSGGTTGGSSSDTALIAGIAGGVGGGLLLCCLLLVVAAVVWGARRGRSPYRKLEQPDYDAVAYGDVKEDVTIPKKQQEEYRALERLLAAPDHRLALAICETANLSDRDVVFRSLVRVLAGQYQAYNFIARTITIEVSLADEEGTLFRSNSASVKLFSYYIRMIGLRYLWHVLVLSVHSLNDNARDNTSERSGQVSGHAASSRMFGKQYRMETDGFDDDESSVAMDILGRVSSMELDPQKLDDASDLTINTLELWLTVQKMFKLITQSEKTLPQELRMLIRRIHDEVECKFSEEAVFRAMGGFFFLRLICPALLAPQVHGLLDDPPHPMAQRQLILVTKVLQNLANDTLPGAKEAYMEKLNTFIVTNKPALAQFYQQIVNHPEHGKLSDCNVPQRARNDALINLRKFLDTNLSAIETALRNGEEGGEDVIDELRRILHREAAAEDDQV